MQRGLHFWDPRFGLWMDRHDQDNNTSIVNADLSSRAGRNNKEQKDEEISPFSKTWCFLAQKTEVDTGSCRKVQQHQEESVVIVGKTKNEREGGS